MDGEIGPVDGRWGLRTDATRPAGPRSGRRQTPPARRRRDAEDEEPDEEQPEPRDEEECRVDSDPEDGKGGHLDLTA